MKKKKEENHVIYLSTDQQRALSGFGNYSLNSQDRECKWRNLLSSSGYLVPLVPKYFTSETELLRVEEYNWKDDTSGGESNQCTDGRAKRKRKGKLYLKIDMCVTWPSTTPTPLSNSIPPSAPPLANQCSHSSSSSPLSPLRLCCTHLSPLPNSSHHKACPQETSSLFLCCHSHLSLNELFKLPA